MPMITERIAIFLYPYLRGRIVVIEEACPPADTCEATEKLYERHCLVSKIVSSFFAGLTKFIYL